MPPSPKIAIIILNWNGLEDTKECLESVAKTNYPNYSLYIIDNASNNDDLKKIKSFASSLKLQAKYFQNASNLGFAGGNNVGIKQAISDGADWIFLLNNDTVVEPNFLSAAIEVTTPDSPENLESPDTPVSPKIGILATTMINYYKRSKLDNIGHELLSTGDTIPRSRNSSVHKALQTPQALKAPLFGACAGAAMYSSKMLKEIGLLDEEFFLNYEDSDLSLRGIVRGWHCVWALESKIYHKLNASIKKIKNVEYSIRSQRNQLWAYFHNIPLPVVLLNLPWMIIRDLLVVIISLFTLRWTITKVLILSRWEFIKSLPKVLKKRRKVLKHQKTSSWWIWKNQRCWFSSYWEYFKLIILKGNKSIMEK